MITGVAPIYQTLFKVSSSNCCCVSDSERQDQPEDQGEVPVPSRKHLQGSHCQPIQLEPEPLQQCLCPHQPHDTQGKKMQHSVSF